MLELLTLIFVLVALAANIFTLVMLGKIARLRRDR